MHPIFIHHKTKIMKNSITQFATIIIAFVALSLLMSYTRPAADEAKQYMLIKQELMKDWTNKLEYEVSQKQAEGWHCQGGVALFAGLAVQPMVK